MPWMGKCEKYYTHGVPEAYEMSKACDGTATASKELEQRCISIVFPYGKQKTYMKDSGKPCCDLNPAVVYRDKRPWFGSLCGLYAEGWVYSRSDMMPLLSLAKAK